MGARWHRAAHGGTVTIGPGVRVRVKSIPGDPCVTDGMVGVVRGPATVPVVTKGDDGIPAGRGWEGYVWVGMAARCWDVVIAGWGWSSFPEEKLEPIDDALELEAVAGAVG